MKCGEDRLALDVAEVLHGAGIRVSIVNPARVKVHGQSELARNKTDKLDAALIARFCRAHQPTAWTPPAGHRRETRELVRRCDSLKAARVQEINRKKSGTALSAVADSIMAHLDWLDRQIEAVMRAVQALVAADPVLSRNHELLLSIPASASQLRPCCWPTGPTHEGDERRRAGSSQECRLQTVDPQ